MLTADCKMKLLINSHNSTERSSIDFAKTVERSLKPKGINKDLNFDLAYKGADLTVCALY